MCSIYYALTGLVNYYYEYVAVENSKTPNFGAGISYNKTCVKTYKSDNGDVLSIV